MPIAPPIFEYLSKIVSPVRPQALSIVPKSLEQAGTLRGGGLQQVGQLLNQLKNRPGVTKQDLAMWSHVDPAQRIPPQELSTLAKVPKLYAQKASSPPENLDDMANDLIWHHDLFPVRSQTYRSLIGDILEENPEPKISSQGAYLLSRLQDAQQLPPTSGEVTRIEQLVRGYIDDYHPHGEDALYEALLDDDWFGPARDLARKYGVTKTFEPAYSGFQRQPYAQAMQDYGGNYFETVLRGAPSYERGIKQSLMPEQLETYHFSNPAQLGQPQTEGVQSTENQVVTTPEEVEGYVSIKKQRRVSRKINKDVAEELIALKGMEDKLFKTIRVVDEDALMAALYEGELTEDEIDLMYPQQIVWALVMNKR